ncbi:PadR family transcriptional regulator [Pullulanibacillus camelliae]|uniref:PadR family transcriptional regulator n=1 Tax=Pullulanibacillus camelliae TaxID=1707096 RepID=A0A8J2YI52_9BACL|nr:PadR family transcriptional regulator [Pullulanibacillus camelliae]GGE44795.1 PadR family transcriptional regulator [Pullulanibacillus camelliae]
MAKYKKIESFLPLTHTTYYILLALISPAHGYGIMQEVKAITHGEIALGPGTLYGALSKLTKQGLITKLEEFATNRRKYYTLTPLGRQVVKAEYERIKSLVENSSELIQGLEGEDE